MTKILLVDDEADTRIAYADLLASEGYEVTTASSGPEATAQTGRSRPDLVLLDVMMPGQSGIDVAREWSERQETKDIPIVLITALSAQEELKAVPGVRRIIYKPCRPRTLLEGVDHVLRYGR